MRSSRLVLTGWLLVIAAAATVILADFRIDNSVSIWFDATDPALVTYRQSLEDFGEREWILVVMERGAGAGRASASPEADRARLVARLLATPDVHAVLSAADFPPDAPFVRQFLRPSAGGLQEGLLVQVTNELVRQDGYRETLVRNVRAAATDLPTVAAVRVAGIAVINGELNRSARRDMFLFFPAVGVLLALLGLVLFRSARDTLVLLAVALGTVVITTGLLIGVGHPLNMVTIMLPTVLIALSVADVVHLVQVFHATRGEDAAARPAAARAVRAILWPCAGTTLTTVAGFLAFAGSSVLPVLQLALFGSFGIVLAWVLTLTFGAPLLVALWDGRPRARRRGLHAGAPALDGWWQQVARHPHATLAVFGAGSFALAGLGSLQADTDYVRFFHSDARVPREYRALQAAGFPQNPVSLVVALPPVPNALRRYDAAVAAFARDLERVPGVSSVLSPYSFGPSAAALGETGTRLGMISRDGRRLQLAAMMDYPSSRSLLASLRAVRALADSVLPAEVSVTPTGTSLLWAHMDEGVIRTQRQSLAIVSLVCFLILCVLFRSPALGLLGLGVSLYPVAMVLGLMGLWRIPLNMATVLIAGVAVGLAVDDTIHFVHAWQGLRRSGADRASACRTALSQVGGRIVMTSLILVGAFAILGLSDFMPTAHFGLLSSLTVALALVADLTLLPVLLAWGARAPHATTETPFITPALGGSCE